MAYSLRLISAVFICFLQTMGAAIMYTPVELFLLGICSLGGSVAIKSVRARADTMTRDAEKNLSTSE